MARFDRLLALAHLLAGPKRYRLHDLVERLEATPRTIYRDLAALESRGFAIDRTDGTYRLMDGGAARPLPLTSRERAILSVALDNPSLRRQPSLARDLKQLRVKLAGDPKSEASVLRLAGPDRSGAIIPAIHDEVENAIRECRSLSILYTSLTNGQPVWRGVDPWAFAHRSEAWYLVGRCHVHDEPRTFRGDRIEAVLPIGTSFQPPRDFDVERWLEGRWGIFDGDAHEESVIWFERALAPLIEHAQHHSTESKRRLSDGSLEYRVRVRNLQELARWIVGFAGRARAVEPQELIEAVNAIATAASSAHGRKRAAAMVRRQRKTD